MEKRFRVSAIGRIRPGVDHEDVKAIVTLKLAEKGMRADDLRWLTIPSDGSGQLYAKFSAVIPEGALDDAWNIRASRSFSDAGYGDVTWKITPVEPHDPDCENTTCSIPEDLMSQWLRANDQENAHKAEMPPKPFGSERFWAWFDDMEE